MQHSTQTVKAGEGLAQRYRSVRSATETLIEPLEPEDCVVQSMPDVSPTKWHLAHVSWFFETFLLKPYLDGYQAFDDSYEFLFNSYYNAVGAQYPRPKRGHISRPTLSRVMAYRAHVDEHIDKLLDKPQPEVAELIELGLNHEQQHQELLLMDIKHVLFQNPVYPAYQAGSLSASSKISELRYVDVSGGLFWIGHDGSGFCFDNEGPRHRYHLSDFCLASRLVTNGEYAEFIRDGGYETAALWLSDGWCWLREQGVKGPLYWVERDGEFFEFSLGGLSPLASDLPVRHVSYYEALAFAFWKGNRLPSEFEWEVVAERTLREPDEPDGFDSLLGELWQWTQSAYTPYPGYAAPAGAVGEYNGKFMCNQMVARGGSFATPANHLRLTYRNFFYPNQRWFFSGIRLAKDLSS